MVDKGEYLWGEVGWLAMTINPALIPEANWKPEIDGPVIVEILVTITWVKKNNYGI